MKFGQLIKCNMRNNFLEKPYIKCGEKTIPRPFSKKIKIKYNSEYYSKILYSLFLMYAKFRAIKIY